MFCTKKERIGEGEGGEEGEGEGDLETNQESTLLWSEVRRREGGCGGGGSLKRG